MTADGVQDVAFGDVLASWMPHPHGQDLPADLVHDLTDAQPDGWQEDAVCADRSRGLDPDLWFPNTGGRDVDAAAIDVCAVCPVQRPCLAWALLVGERYGVWGAVSPGARLILRKNLAKRYRMGMQPAELLPPLVTRRPRRHVARSAS